VWRSVADPWGVAAMKMDGCAVIKIRRGAIGEAKSGPHDGLVDRNKEIAAGASRKLVCELDPHRPIGLGNNQRTKVMDRCRTDGVLAGRLVRSIVRLNIPAQLGCREIGVHLLVVFAKRDLVVIGAWKGLCTRNCDWNLLSQVVSCIH